MDEAAAAPRAAEMQLCVTINIEKSLPRKIIA